jgi:release factor glutamine methyltransferase
MGLEFKVTPAVLIPRQETEILVEVALRQLRTPNSELRAINILDLGTGSGCIAVSLAKLLRQAKITATDISESALEIARHNAESNNVADKIKFIQSDLFNNYELRTMNYELIISNPPYIASGEIDHLQPEVKYEPRIALDGGQDGLDFFRKIIIEAPRYLKKEGLLMLEVGFGQASAIKNIFQKSEDFEIIETVKDYHNIDRVMVAKRTGKHG